jgi:hypothetical protein
VPYHDFSLSRTSSKKLVVVAETSVGPVADTRTCMAGAPVGVPGIVGMSCGLSLCWFAKYYPAHGQQVALAVIMNIPQNLFRYGIDLSAEAFPSN